MKSILLGTFTLYKLASSQIIDYGSESVGFSSSSVFSPASHSVLTRQSSLKTPAIHVRVWQQASFPESRQG